VRANGSHGPFDTVETLRLRLHRRCAEGSGHHSWPGPNARSVRCQPYDEESEVQQRDRCYVDNRANALGPPAPPGVARSRLQLALVVAEWAVAWRPEGATDDDTVPRELFRDDEIETVESLEAHELLWAAHYLLVALANHVTREGRMESARRIRRFSNYMGWQACRSHVVVVRNPTRASRRRAGGRRRSYGARRVRARAPTRPSDEPHQRLAGCV
jgi:hypothetical protein